MQILQHCILKLTGVILRREKFPDVSKGKENLPSYKNDLRNEAINAK